MAPPPAATGSGNRTALAIAAGLLAIGAGAAAAIALLGGGSDKAGLTPHGSRAAAIVPAAAAPRRTGQAGTPTEHAGFPPETRAQMAEEIQAMLLSFHQDVVDRRFDAAWALLSERKRSQSLREYGYAKWVRNQATLSPFLDPSGLAVRIEALEGEGVARVLVTGMGWSKPGASCAEWSGLTWVKYESGEWTYDPGYSTTAVRRREWEPRNRELLGARC